MFKSLIYLPPYITHIAYTERLIFTEHFHRIPITARKHIDFGIDSILYKCKKSYSKWNYITTQILLTKNILSYVIMDFWLQHTLC